MATSRSLALSWRKHLAEVKESQPFGPLSKKFDVTGGLHCETGPAYISPTRCIWYYEGNKHGLDVDIFGTRLYYFRGVCVPPRYVEEPELLTLEEILCHRNAEVRYVGMEIYGYDRMEETEQFQVVDHDKESDAKLLKFTSDHLEEPLMLVRVINGTPEPDGTYKVYFLRVPPEMKRAKEAVAWTFRYEEADYNPSVET